MPGFKQIVRAKPETGKNDGTVFRYDRFAKTADIAGDAGETEHAYLYEMNDDVVFSLKRRDAA